MYAMVKGEVTAQIDELQMFIYLPTLYIIIF